MHTHRLNSSSSRSRGSAAADNAESQSMELLSHEARSLQRSLLSTMMGDRLCRNFDWTLSALDAMEDDVSSWMARLSFLEREMFARGVEASGAVRSWREVGSGRLGVSSAVVRGRTAASASSSSSSGATPGGGAGGEKRRVVTPVGGEAAGMGKSF